MCIVAGVALVHLLPGLFKLVAGLEVAKVNLPVGPLIWAMIIPMLLKIHFAAPGQVRAHAHGIDVTLKSKVRYWFSCNFRRSTRALSSVSCLLPNSLRCIVASANPLSADNHSTW